MTRHTRFGAIFVAVATAIAALALVSTARDASAAANLVTNGDVSSATTDWMPFPVDSALAWAAGPAGDADASAASGSIQVIWTNADGYSQAIAEQACVSLPAVTGTYELMGASKLASGNDASTAARMRVELFTDGICSALDTTAYTTTNSLNDGAWHAVTNMGVGVLSSHLSARIQLVLDVNDLAPAPLAYFDNVSFSNGPVDTPTPASTSTPTSTSTATDAPTSTPTPTNTSTPTNTPTSAPTNTPHSATNTRVATSTAAASATASAQEPLVSDPPVVGPPPESGIEPRDGGDVAAGDAGAGVVALPNAGTGDASQGSTETIVLLVGLASGAAGGLMFAAGMRRKRTGT